MLDDSIRMAIAKWIFDGKITIHDLPEDVRREYYETFYIYTFRRFRDLYQVSEYVKAMRLLWEDWEYTKKYGPAGEAYDMMERLFDAYWGVELLFKGEKEFEKLVQTLAKRYPKIFGGD